MPRKPQTVKVIKIDVDLQVVHYVEIPKSDSLNVLYRQICCETIAHFYLDDEHSVVYDDEGLYRQKVHGGIWMLPTFNDPVIGNAIISRIDDDGCSAPPDDGLLTWLRQNILFYKIGG